MQSRCAARQFSTTVVRAAIRRINPDETIVAHVLFGVPASGVAKIRWVGDDFRAQRGRAEIYFGVYGLYGVLTLLREVIVTGKRLQMNLVLT